MSKYIEVSCIGSQKRNPKQNNKNKQPTKIENSILIYTKHLLRHYSQTVKSLRWRMALFSGLKIWTKFYINPRL